MTINPSNPTEPGWITTDPWGVVEFWPVSEWDVEDETDSGCGWVHWLTSRSDDDGPTRSFPRGYRIQTAVPTADGIMIVEQWERLVAPVKDVHTEHCCSDHGCKYQDSDCTVTSGNQPQSFPCEICEFVREQVADYLPEASDDELIAEVFIRGLLVDEGSRDSLRNSRIMFRAGEPIGSERLYRISRPQ